MRHPGLLLIERYATTMPATLLETSEEVMASYRGFDGIAWPGETIHEIWLYDGLAPVEQLGTVRCYYDTIKHDRSVDLVMLAAGADVDLAGFQFAGFDVGFYDSEYSHYSVVLHEVLFGSVPELQAFVRDLNDARLFGSYEDAEALVRCRERVAETDAEIEDGEEEIMVIPIHAIDRRRSD